MKVEKTEVSYSRAKISAGRSISQARGRRTGMRVGCMPAGGLAARDLDVLFQARLGRERLRVPVSSGDSAISSRTVMNIMG